MTATMLNRKSGGALPALAAIGYIRVSDPKQTEGVSLDQQRAAIRRYAKLQRIPLLDILEDAGESAKTLERPHVQELVRRLEAGEASAVIVYDLDRLSRYVPDYYLLVDRVMNPRGIRLADTASGWVDTVTPRFTYAGVGFTSRYRAPTIWKAAQYRGCGKLRATSTCAIRSASAFVAPRSQCL